MKIKSFSLFFVFCVGHLAWCRSTTVPPLSDTNWRHLVGGKANTSYTVKPGDSLSKICRDQLGDVDYWPKLWEVNRESISNPHLLEPEQKLQFCRTEKETGRKLASESSASSPKRDIGLTDELIRPNLAHQHRLRYLFFEGQEVLGIITGSYDRKNFLGVESKIYIGPLNRNQLSVGKKYAIVRKSDGPIIKARETRKVSQPLLKILGEVEIESLGRDLAQAKIVSVYDLVERGDKIMDIPALSMQEPALTPPKNFMTKVLVGDNLDVQFFIRGQLVILDKGSSSGMQLGYVFHVFDDTDPVFNNQKLIEPRSKGEVKVVHLGNETSVGYIQKSIAGIEVGDVLVSREELADSKFSFSNNRTKVVLE